MTCVDSDNEDELRADFARTIKFHCNDIHPGFMREMIESWIELYRKAPYAVRKKLDRVHKIRRARGV